ncbi:MAG: hypothetical protein QXR53_04085 [Candidatus Norongarragalinales archaeon]
MEFTYRLLAEDFKKKLEARLPHHEIVPHHFESESILELRLGKNKERVEDLLHAIRKVADELIDEESYGHTWGFHPRHNPTENRIEVTLANMNRILEMQKRP